MKFCSTYIFIFLSIIFISTLPAPGLAEDYVIGVKDIIQIDLYGDPDFGRNVEVRADGYITVPLIGKIKAAGLSITQLEDKITELLEKDYYVDPYINILVLEYNSKTVLILGQIRKPGEYPLKERTPVLRLITLAGGLLEKCKNAVIFRKKKNSPDSVKNSNGDTLPAAGKVSSQKPISSNDKSDSVNQNLLTAHYKKILDAEPITVNIDSILSQGNYSENIILEPGDIVYIPPPDFYFVFGEVNKPGGYKYEEGLTVLKAISFAGGFSEIARKSGITITRNNVKIDAELEAKVEPEDIIMVPQAWF